MPSSKQNGITAPAPMEHSETSPEVCVHLEGGEDQRFTSTFRIGRGEECEVQIDSSKASRTHVEVFFENGRWGVRDLGSTNGTFVDGKEITRLQLEDTMRLQIGRNGVQIRLEFASEEAKKAGATEPPSTRQAGSPSGASVTRYVERYFAEESHDGESAGQHTQMMRQAYQRVQKKQKRRYTWIIGAVLALCLGLGGYAAVQYRQNQQLRKSARGIFYQLKEQDIAISNLKRYVKNTSDATLAKQLAQLEKRRQNMANQYEGYVRELGMRRGLSEKEKLIYQVARIFNESEFGIPAGFIRRVRAKINNYWLTPSGKRRLRHAIQRAEKKGYTPLIVKTMQAYGLPPEFFYLALQESNFNRKAVGPETRWGIAKGAWQFIPSTARKYGLSVGPRKEERVVDAQDERHNFQKSTKAAARYLQDIYSTLAQASGLLVIASYNWGEHRVVAKMKHLPGPQAIPKEALEGIPENPKARNYWRFLTKYEKRMPEQTKDYVLKIVSAAVIGQQPRLFGIDLDNPLHNYMQAPKMKETSP